MADAQRSDDLRTFVARRPSESGWSEHGGLRRSDSGESDLRVGSCAVTLVNGFIDESDDDWTCHIEAAVAEKITSDPGRLAQILKHLSAQSPARAASASVSGGAPAAIACLSLADNSRGVGKLLHPVGMAEAAARNGHPLLLDLKLRAGIALARL
jgi:hypothetical protein